MITIHRDIPSRAMMALSKGNKRDIRAAILLGELCENCEHIRIRHATGGRCAGGELVEVKRIGPIPIFEIRDSECECQESQISILERSVRIFTMMSMGVGKSVHEARRFIEFAMNSKPNYAVMKKGRKNALRIKGLDAYYKAWLWAAENGYVINGKLADGISIQLRKDDRQRWSKWALRVLKPSMIERVFLNALEGA